MTRLRVCAALAALYAFAILLTGCHDVPATYTAPISTWENQ